MDIDDEAERLARAHPQYGTLPETHTSAWMPQHAVPKHRKPAPMSRIDLEYIDRRVDADIARIDRELDPQASPPAFEQMLTLTRAWSGVDSWFAQNYRDAYVHDPAALYFQDIKIFSDFASRVVKSKVGPGKQRKPKTYVAPGRKQGKTWIARLNQSKEARNARTSN